MKKALFFASVVVAAFAAYGQDRIDESNWLTHPDIVEIRGMVNRIEADIGRGACIEKTAERDYVGPYKDTLRQIFTDSTGFVRKLIRQGGSDDSAVTYTYYYDAGGALRFVYIVGGAVNGTVIQHRIYFDPDGVKIWEIQKLVKGPGYAFPTVWPREEMVLDPAGYFLAGW